MKANNIKEASKHIRIKDLFDNLKSKYILEKVFSFLQEKKSLEIIKYNNNTKKRLNLNIDNYKEYCEKYSSIEIEIIPANNKYGKFINIKEDDKLYYHIYFNKKEEIKINYLKEEDKVTTINIKIDYHIISFKYLFDNCKCIESIYFKKFYRNTINDMSYMFYDCSLLKEINLSNFYTNKVTDMSYMFYGCSSLKKINLFSFNTNNVIDMKYMFTRCTSLKEINLSNFKTNKVNNMTNMFRECSSLKTINLSNFKVYNVTNMSFMFYGCSSLKELNFSNVRYHKACNMRLMFFGCSDGIKMKIRSEIKNINENAFII